jgi:single-strand DNA-binding protein
MANFNKVILAGNLTRDPELRYTPGGKAIAKFGLAVNRSWTNEAGEKKEEVLFVDIAAFARQAEVISQYFKKGRPILIEGRLKLDTWDDKQTGAKRSKHEVVLETFSFMDSKADGGGSAPTPLPPRSAAATQAANVPVAAGNAEDSGPPPADDDVPF